jgi:hypothetical protein
MNETAARLTLLFVLGALLINFPLLAIFNRAATLGGVPLVYLYLFGVWAAGIAGVWILVGKRRDDEPPAIGDQRSGADR